jgi:hypothetical protein
MLVMMYEFMISRNDSLMVTIEQSQFCENDRKGFSLAKPPVYGTSFHLCEPLEIEILLHQLSLRPKLKHSTK